MSAPTAGVRQATYWRDDNRCVRCGRHDQLTYQHRRAVGSGGSKLPPSIDDGLTACASCNARFESDLQTEALGRGWKVRRWCKTPYVVPVFYAYADEWWLLLAAGGRVGPIDNEMAQALMRLVYGQEMADADR